MCSLICVCVHCYIAAGNFMRIDLGAAYNVKRVVIFFWHCLGCDSASVRATSGEANFESAAQHS